MVNVLKDAFGPDTDDEDDIDNDGEGMITGEEDDNDEPEDDQDDENDDQDGENGDGEGDPPSDPAGEAAAAPVVPPAGFVPVQAVTAARAKNRELEAELNQLRQQYDPAFQVPEAGTPEYQRYQQEVVQREIINTNLNASERFARKAHGEALVDSTKEWFESLAASNPQRAAQILTSEDPYEEAISEYNKSKEQETELEGYRAWVAAGKPTTPPPVPPKKPIKPSEFAARQASEAAKTPPPRTKAAPPKTLLDAPSAGGAKGIKTGPVGVGVAFRDTFGNKG